MSGETWIWLAAMIAFFTSIAVTLRIFAKWAVKAFKTINALLESIHHNTEASNRLTEQMKNFEQRTARKFRVIGRDLKDHKNRILTLEESLTRKKAG